MTAPWQVGLVPALMRGFTYGVGEQSRRCAVRCATGWTGPPTLEPEVGRAPECDDGAVDRFADINRAARARTNLPAPDEWAYTDGRQSGAP